MKITNQQIVEIMQHSFELGQQHPDKAYDESMDMLESLDAILEKATDGTVTRFPQS